MKEGIFFTKEELSRLISVKSLCAINTYIELKCRGGHVFSERSLRNEYLSYSAVRRGIKILEKFNLIRKGDSKKGLNSEIAVNEAFLGALNLNAPCAQFECRCATDERTTALNLNAPCPIYANDLKEKRTKKENTADSDRYIVNYSYLVSTSQSQKIYPPVNFNSYSQNEYKLKYDIPRWEQMHFTEGKNSCQEKSNRIRQDNIEFNKIASKVIKYLNEKTGKRFDADGLRGQKNRERVIARLKEGYTENEIIGVIDMAIKNWSKKEGMYEYIRPKTLFGRDNFSNYVGMVGVQAPKRKTLDEMCVYVEQKMKERERELNIVDGKWSEEQWNAWADEEKRLFDAWGNGEDV